MLRLEELKDEGQKFLTDYHYADLDDLAKMSVNTYMKGLIDGRRLAVSEAGKKSELAAV